MPSRFRRLLQLALLLPLSCTSNAALTSPLPAPNQSAEGLQSEQRSEPESERQSAGEASREDWLGFWAGEFGGTQEFVTLELRTDGLFTAHVVYGPDETCELRGKYQISASELSFEPFAPGQAGQGEQKGCPTASFTAYTRVHQRSPDSFVLTQAGLEEHIHKDSKGQFRGPLWSYRRIVTDGLTPPVR